MKKKKSKKKVTKRKRGRKVKSDVKIFNKLDDFTVEDLKGDFKAMRRFVNLLVNRNNENRACDSPPTFNIGKSKFHGIRSEISSLSKVGSTNVKDIFMLLKLRRGKFVFDVDRKSKHDNVGDGHFRPICLGFSPITPEQALYWLVNHDSNNRKVKLPKLEAYARSIVDGEWKLTHQGLGFYDDGSFADGQHRLLAILFSGESVEMMVTCGMCSSAKMYVDEGTQRSLQDIGKIVFNDNILTTAIKTAAWMINTKQKLNKESTGLYRAEIYDFYHQYQEGIDKVCSYATKTYDPDKVLGIATIRAALTRLWYNLDMYKGYTDDPKKRFEELIYVITKGTAYRDRDMDSGAIKVHELRVSPKGKQSFSGNCQKIGYFYTEKGADAFMKCESVKNLRLPKYPKERYLLGDEKRDK